MDSSALASALDNFEKSWSALDWWLNFWTVLVVVGVAVELLVLIIEYVHERRDFKRRVIHSPDKPSVLVYGLGFIGAALVAFGVAGEFRVHIKAGKIESEMREATRKLVALVQADTGKANERAGVANQKAGEADRQAKESGRQTAIALLAQEKLKAENLRLEALIQPRELTGAEKASLREAVKPFAGRSLTIISYGMGAQARRLGNIIGPVLWDARIRAENRLGTMNVLGGGFVEGIEITGPDSQNDLIAALLKSPLGSDKRFGAFKGVNRNKSQGAPVNILIGVKPILEEPKPQDP